MKISNTELSDVIIAFALSLVYTREGLASYKSFLITSLVSEIIINLARIATGKTRRDFRTIIIIFFASAAGWAARALVNEAIIVQKNNNENNTA